MVVKTAELRKDDRPQWRDVRERLKDQGVRPEDAALGQWHEAGMHAMSGVVGTRDGRLFHFGVTYDFDQSDRPLGPGLGWVHRWAEIPANEIVVVAPGRPNAWAQALHVARLVFESEAGGPR
ncbi:MAG TPA: hypothetical protein VHN37_12845 [Actinomycetota bacterium]|nr:hypothetical protein [Actinomycetota bacterium]